MTTDKAEIFSNPEKFHAHVKSVQQAELSSPESQVAQNPTTQNNQSSEVRLHDMAEQANQDQTTDSNSDFNNVAESDSTHEMETQPSTEPQPRKQHNIPQSRFNQEIEKRKALEAQLTKEREDRIRYETQLQMIQQQMQSQPIPESYRQEPTPEIDPLDPESHGLYMNKIAMLEKKLENISQETTHKTQQLHFQQMVTAQEQAFERQNPDFKEALRHLATVETKIAEQFYPPEQAKQMAAQKLEAAITFSLQQGKNAAESMYNMAKTYGYAPNSAKNNSNSPQNKVNLDALNNNMRKSASIGGLGNSASMSAAQQAAGGVTLLRDPKNPFSGVDADAFHRQLNKLKG